MKPRSAIGGLGPQAPAGPGQSPGLANLTPSASSPWPLFLLVAFCFLGPEFWRIDPFHLDPDVLAQPSWKHPMGTDALGRDELARLIEGGAETLQVAMPAAALAFVLGVAYGLASGLGAGMVGPGDDAAAGCGAGVAVAGGAGLSFVPGGAGRGLAGAADRVCCVAVAGQAGARRGFCAARAGFSCWRRSSWGPGNCMWRGSM